MKSRLDGIGSPQMRFRETHSTLQELADCCRRWRNRLGASVSAFTFVAGLPAHTAMALGRCMLPAAAAGAALLCGCAVAPDPIAESEFRLTAADRAVRVDAGQELVHGTVDLYQAMARALKYNLDAWIESRQTALRQRELDLSHFALLPQVVAGSGYAQRDSFPASRSIGIDKASGIPTGENVLSYNSSQERQTRTADMAFSWHVLDFGLSLVRARQAADRVLIAAETRRKVMNRIVEDVRTAFWRAASAERLIASLIRLEVRTRAALASARATAAERQTPMIAALTYERELLEIRRTLQDLKRDISIAKFQLAALMNLKPGTPYRIDYRRVQWRHDTPPFSIDRMIDLALVNRPELRDMAYQQRISAQEAHAALLELLPGLQLHAGRNADANAYLLNSDWISWGAKASWNLIKLAQYPARREVLESESRLLDERALAMTMAVMTQAHVARARYVQSSALLSTTSEYLAVQRRIVENMRIERGAGRISEQTLIREEMNTLIAEARSDIAFADLQNALANVYASIGVDPLDPDIELSRDVSFVARSIRATWLERGDWQSGQRLAAAHVR